MRVEISEFNSEAYDHHIIDVGGRKLAVDIFDKDGSVHIYDDDDRTGAQLSLLSGEAAELVTILARNSVTTAIRRRTNE